MAKEFRNDRDLSYQPCGEQENTQHDISWVAAVAITCQFKSCQVGLT